MDWQDAEDVLREKGADYIKTRIAKLEKRHAKPKVKPDLSILIRGIATAYYLNDDSEKLDLIMQDLQYLGFTDVTCTAKKGEDGYVYGHQVVFSGRHTDPTIQAEFVITPRTDVLYQYKFEYGQLRCIPFGSSGSPGQKEAGTKNLHKLCNLAYKITGNGTADRPSYLQRTLGYEGCGSHSRSAYDWTPIWEAPNVAEEQERKKQDVFESEKQASIRSAQKHLDDVVSSYHHFVTLCHQYQKEYNEPLPQLKAEHAGYYPGSLRVIFTVSGEGTTCPTVTIERIIEEADSE
jgi:hypothetical protein